MTEPNTEPVCQKCGGSRVLPPEPMTLSFAGEKFTHLSESRPCPFCPEVPPKEEPFEFPVPDQGPPLVLNGGM